MAEVNHTAQWQCDRRCGAVSDPIPVGALPDGWLHNLGLRMADGFGVIDHLCPACAQMPVAQARIPAEPAEPAESF